MSKTFDEGGAKGLLLVNLGVGPKGCNIVFDSKQEDEEEEIYSEVEYTEGMVDITSLTLRCFLQRQFPWVWPNPRRQSTWKRTWH
jgi:hypothetical protein